ncbi:MAG: L-histidine N(alpha)-methyltransferase [Candidatus Pacearchaeota archaeon]
MEKEIILKEFVKRGYSLEDNCCVWDVSDSKLWYISEEQAKLFIKIEKIDEKQRKFKEEEIKLIRKNFKEILKFIKNKKINVIDLGCGDGKKAFELLSLIKKDCEIRYFPIDINKYMLQEAKKNLEKIKEVHFMKEKENLMNFFEIRKISNKIRDSNFRTHLFLLLGGTLENCDVHELLYEIRSSMKEEDLLLIGNKLAHPSKKKMIDYYLNNDSIKNLLIKTLEIIGFKKKDLDYKVRFRKERIEMFFEVKKDYSFYTNKKKLEFKKGDKIIIAVSYKYNEDRFREILSTYFDNVELFLSPKKDFVLALCMK